MTNCARQQFGKPFNPIGKMVLIDYSGACGYIGSFDEPNNLQNVATIPN